MSKILPQFGLKDMGLIIFFTLKTSKHEINSFTQFFFTLYKLFKGEKIVRISI